jgi:macrodomain Ter protein organizer (MatP/YcbG family)
MDSQNKRKTLVDIDLSIWARVKHFATIEKTSVNEAVEFLLKKGLIKCGYTGRQDKMIPTGESLAASSQQVPVKVQ